MARSIIIKFSPSAARDLREVAKHLDITQEELIRKAYLVMAVYARVTAEGGRFILRDKNGDRQLICHNPPRPPLHQTAWQKVCAAYASVRGATQQIHGAVTLLFHKPDPVLLTGNVDMKLWEVAEKEVTDFIDHHKAI